MDSSRQTEAPFEELRRVQRFSRQSSSLEELRSLFEHLQELRRRHPDDFDFQVETAEVQEELVERGRVLRAQETEQPYRPATPAAKEDDIGRRVDHRHPSVPEMDPQSWKRAVYVGLFFAVLLFAAFFYLIQTARKLNETPNEVANRTPATGATGAQTAKVAGQPSSSSPTAPVPPGPALRLYTDLVPGTVSVNKAPAQELQDGQLQLDGLAAGRHSINVVGRLGNASFEYEVQPNAAPKLVSAPAANEALLVLVAMQNGKADIRMTSAPAELILDGNAAGTIGPEGLTLNNLGTADHDLLIKRPTGQERFILTYTPAPTLTAFVKSDMNAGTIIVVTGEDDVQVFLDGKEYRRKTMRGQLRIPNIKVGAHTVRVQKPGFSNEPEQQIQVKKGDESRVQFKLQPAPLLADLQIRGGLPGMTVMIDRDPPVVVGADGTAVVKGVQPGDHIVELRQDQFKTKRTVRAFKGGETILMTGGEVALDKVSSSEPKPAVASNEPAPLGQPVPPKPENETREGTTVRRGGGFVVYHSTKTPGSYSFNAQLKKGGGLFKGKRVQWFADYRDPKNYVLFQLDGKNISVKEVVDGENYDRLKVPFDGDPENPFQVEMSVKPDAITARVKSSNGSWHNLGPVTDPNRNFTQGKVGFLIPGKDEISISNFHFSGK